MTLLTFLKSLECPSYIAILFSSKALSGEKNFMIETGLSDFHEIVAALMNTPQKKRYLRSNDKPFINNKVLKAITPKLRAI